MKKYCLFFLIFLLSACEQSQPTVFNALQRNAVILAFGDSLTYGLGAKKEASYPSVLSKMSGHTVINAGLSGEISRHGVQRLNALLDQHKPELLILIHGGNDMLKKISATETAANLKQMISAAQQRQIKVIMLGVPRPQLFLLSSADFYQQVATEKNIPIDVDTLTKILGNNNLKSDSIHPNTAGYKLMADNIFALLVDTGAL